MSKLSPADVKLIIITGVCLGLTVLSLWFLWRNGLLLTAVLLILAVVELIAARSKKLIIMFFLCGLGGAVVEGGAIYFGSWQYTEPTFFNIPLWLLPAWGNAGIFIIAFYELLGKVPLFNRNQASQSRAEFKKE